MRRFREQRAAGAVPALVTVALATVVVMPTVVLTGGASAAAPLPPAIVVSATTIRIGETVTITGPDCGKTFPGQGVDGARPTLYYGWPRIADDGMIYEDVMKDYREFEGVTSAAGWTATYTVPADLGTGERAFAAHCGAPDVQAAPFFQGALVQVLPATDPPVTTTPPAPPGDDGGGGSDPTTSTTAVAGPATAPTAAATAAAPPFTG